MKTAEHNIARANVSTPACGAVALSLGWRWYFGFYYFWFAYLTGGPRGYWTRS